MTRSVMSRRTGLAGLRNEPQAQEPLVDLPFCQMISPRNRRPRSSRILIDIGREAAIRLAAEVGDVHRDSAAGLEDPHAFLEDVVEESQILEIAAGNLADSIGIPRRVDHLVLILLADEVRR